jgi:ATP-dependent Clp protease ATP-binding subunit ClpX
MFGKRTASANALQCSFCHRSEDAVGKLISNPSDYPRAYICDECVLLCTSVLEYDAIPARPSSAEPDLLQELLEAVQRWVGSEALGGDASAELAELRTAAQRWLSGSAPTI